jgi:FtsP/CotA-like multicopper oxidase with cupredoxin domain
MFMKTPYSPQLHTVMAGGQLNSTVHAFTYFDGLGAADIGISNHDHNTEHPWHLHSRSFWVVAQGKGELTEAMYKNLTFNLDNPIRRDTVCP